MQGRQRLGRIVGVDGLMVGAVGRIVGVEGLIVGVEGRVGRVVDWAVDRVCSIRSRGQSGGAGADVGQRRATGFKGARRGVARHVCWGETRLRPGRATRDVALCTQQLSCH